MSGKTEIILKNLPAETEKIVPVVNSIAEKFTVPEQVKHDVNLALNEIVTNVISYAYEKADGENEIIVQFFPRKNNIVAKVIDNGKPFDPLNVPSPDITAELENRKIGGLGVLFVKELMDKVEYERKGDKNILTLEKSFTTVP